MLIISKSQWSTQDFIVLLSSFPRNLKFVPSRKFKKKKKTTLTYHFSSVTLAEIISLLLMQMQNGKISMEENLVIPK